MLFLEDSRKSSISFRIKKTFEINIEKQSKTKKEINAKGYRGMGLFYLKTPLFIKKTQKCSIAIFFISIFPEPAESRKTIHTILSLARNIVNITVSEFLGRGATSD